MLLVAEVQCLQIPHLDFGKSTKIIINMDKRRGNEKKMLIFKYEASQKKEFSKCPTCSAIQWDKAFPIPEYMDYDFVPRAYIVLQYIKENTLLQQQLLLLFQISQERKCPKKVASPKPCVSGRWKAPGWRRRSSNAWRRESSSALLFPQRAFRKRRSSQPVWAQSRVSCLWKPSGSSQKQTHQPPLLEPERCVGRSAEKQTRGNIKSLRKRRGDAEVNTSCAGYPKILITGQNENTDILILVWWRVWSFLMCVYVTRHMNVV